MLVFACKDQGPAACFGSSLTLTPDSMILLEAETQQLTSIVLDSRGDTVRLSPAFVSRDAGIAQVSTSGVVTGTLTGTTFIVATCGAGRDSVLFTVLLGTVARSGRPLGAAISSSGVAYVTLLDAAQVALAQLPGMSFSNSITVGSVPTDVQFNNAGDRAYAANQFSQSVTVIEVATSTVVSTLSVTGNPFRVIVPGGDSILWVSTNVDSVYAIRLSTGGIKARFATPALANGFAWRDSLLWMSTRTGGTVIEVNMKTSAPVRTFTVGGVPQDLAVSPDGQRLYIANESGYVQVWNLTNGLQVGPNIGLPGGGGYGMARNPGNGLLYVGTAAFSGTVWVVDPASGQRVRRIFTAGVPRRVAFNAAGTIGIVPNEAGFVDFIR